MEATRAYVVSTKKASEATNVPVTELGPSSSHNKKRIASGDLRQKASKTQIVPSKNLHESANKRSNQLNRLTLKDQAQTEEENQVGDRPRAAAAPSQIILTSRISEEVRIMIARKREEAIQKKKDKEEAIKTKKGREEGEEVERGTHKKQKSKYSENSKKRNLEALEEEEEVEEEEDEKTSTIKRQKLNGQKRNITEVEDSEQENSSKRKNRRGKMAVSS